MVGRKAGFFFFLNFSNEDALFISVLLETYIPFWIFGYE